MSTATFPSTEELVPLDKVDRELSRQLKTAQGTGQAPVVQARMSNLIVFCNQKEMAARVAAEIPAIAAVHPARDFILAGDAPADAAKVSASRRVQCHRVGTMQASSEKIIMIVRERSRDCLPTARHP